ncbi:hypothetical protein DFH27DRAFT_24927 [Peziza echinospora]|nr:hypothetical protein DFH27DRAFT_24927 [Peziza echinospora]
MARGVSNLAGLEMPRGCPATQEIYIKAPRAEIICEKSADWSVSAGQRYFPYFLVYFGIAVLLGTRLVLLILLMIGSCGALLVAMMGGCGGSRLGWMAVPWEELGAPPYYVCPTVHACVRACVLLAWACNCSTYLFLLYRSLLRSVLSSLSSTTPITHPASRRRDRSPSHLPAQVRILDIVGTRPLSLIPLTPLSFAPPPALSSIVCPSPTRRAHGTSSARHSDIIQSLDVLAPCAIVLYALVWRVPPIAILAIITSRNSLVFTPHITFQHIGITISPISIRRTGQVPSGA